MNRLRRYLFNSVTALSVAVGAATLALWARSYRVETSIHREWLELTDGVTKFRFVHFICVDGSCIAYSRQYWVTPDRAPHVPDDSYHVVHRGSPSKSSVPLRRSAGFSLSWDQPVPGAASMFATGLFRSRYDYVSFPMWSVVVISAIVPALAVRRALWKRRARRLGLCESCGYDLRASRMRCPECGAEIRDSGHQDPSTRVE
jgi:hypothetical protein